MGTSPKQTRPIKGCLSSCYQGGYRTGFPGSHLLQGSRAEPLNLNTSEAEAAELPQQKTSDTLTQFSKKPAPASPVCAAALMHPWLKRGHGSPHPLQARMSCKSILPLIQADERRFTHCAATPAAPHAKRSCCKGSPSGTQLLLCQREQMTCSCKTVSWFNSLS